MYPVPPWTKKKTVSKLFPFNFYLFFKLDKWLFSAALSFTKQISSGWCCLWWVLMSRKGTSFLQPLSSTAHLTFLHPPMSLTLDILVLLRTEMSHGATHSVIISLYRVFQKFCTGQITFECFVILTTRYWVNVSFLLGRKKKSRGSYRVGLRPPLFEKVCLDLACFKGSYVLGISIHQTITL